MILSLIITCAISLGNIYSSLSLNYDYVSNNSPYNLGLLISNNDYIMDGTQVTIFTHGMGNEDSYTDWLPLGADSDLSLSLPFSISLDNTFYINDSDTISKISYDPSENTWSKLNSGYSIDISKHICLLYSGLDDTSNYYSNEYLYERFENAIDSFLYMLYCKLGVIPKINLIGHSRGGIINLLYAINHPKIVSNLISVGTPYAGSQWAQLLINFLTAYEAMGGDEYNGAYDDIVDATKCTSYKNQWNAVASIYNINTKIIGCNQTYNFLNYSLNSLFYGNNINNGLNSFLYYVQSSTNNVLILSACSDLIQALSAGTYQGLAEGLKPLLITLMVISGLCHAFSNADYFENLHALFETAFNIVNSQLTLDGIDSDLCVDFNSQKGIFNNDSYYNFTTQDLTFNTIWDNAENMRIYSPAVLHNLETKAPLVINSVLSTLNSNSSYLHSHTFSLSNDFNHHFLVCSCGAKCMNALHEYIGSYSYYDTTYDYRTCACGYVSLSRHAFNVTLVNGLHHCVCTRCGYTVDKNTHAFTYIPFSSTLHKTRCACGYGSKDPHIFNSDGYCETCLYRGT